MAFGLLRPETSVFLDAGTTVLQLARRLNPMPLGVFTNCLPVAHVLWGAPEVHVTLLGGSLRRETAAMVGMLTEAALEHLWFDQLFLGAATIDRVPRRNSDGLHCAHEDRLSAQGQMPSPGTTRAQAVPHIRPTSQSRKTLNTLRHPRLNSTPHLLRLGRLFSEPVLLEVDGAHDLTCTPEDARCTAAAIPGATRTVMKELGHFPMSEHPTGFRPFFADALARMKVHADV